MKFSSNKRIRKAQEFLNVKKNGTRIVCGCFIAQALANNLDVSRLGVVASRKTGNAVVRNRAKRVFRELFRLTYENLPKEVDLVIVVWPNFVKYSFSDLRERLLKAYHQFK